MSSVQIITPSDRAEWDSYVSNRKDANFLQSWDFYEFHKARGKTIIRRLVKKSGKIVGAYAGVVETARRGRYLAIAGGPLIDYQNDAIVNTVFSDIKALGHQNHCVFVRVRPQEPMSDNILDILAKHGLKKAPMFLSVEYAGILDLTKPEEEILKNASQGFRRKLRKAEKADITVEASTSDEAINDFCKLEKLHAKRQEYVAFSSDFLKKQFEAFRSNNEVIIYTAKKDGEILAQNFMIFYGTEASYHYGVSSVLGTKYSAAPLLHLEAMREARRRNMTRYNLWGIVGTNETSHRFYGVSEFKRSFGCEELRYAPAHDLILRPLPYLLDKTVELARKKIRHI